MVLKNHLRITVSSYYFETPGVFDIMTYILIRVHLSCRGLIYIVVCSAASLVFSHEMPVAHTPLPPQRVTVRNVSRLCQEFPGETAGESAEIADHSSRFLIVFFIISFHFWWVSVAWITMFWVFFPVRSYSFFLVQK